MYVPNDVNQSVEPKTVEHGTDLDAGDSIKEETQKRNDFDFDSAPEHVAVDDELNNSTEVRTVENDTTLVSSNKATKIEDKSEFEYGPKDVTASIETEKVEHGKDLDIGDSTKQENEKRNNSDCFATHEHLSLAENSKQFINSENLEHGNKFDAGDSTKGETESLDSVAGHLDGCHKGK